MQNLVQLIESALGEQGVILAAIFAGAVVVALVVLFAAIPMLETRRRLKRVGEPDFVPGKAADPALSGQINQELLAYYDTFLKGEKNSLKLRLIKAGYFGPNAIYVYNVVRFAGSVLLFVGSFYAIRALFPSGTTLSTAIVAALVGGLGMILPSFMLDRLIASRHQRYQALFPDFIDMLIVCTDAGLSIEASANRVAREYLVRDRAFGIHLGVMMLEVRAGKRLRDALLAMSDRIGVEEARTLATLFKQSEELGVSLTKALRTHSREMRQMRILRAEEKANALPVKMLMPMGAFIFPVTLIIVLTPVMIKLIAAIKSMSPGA